MFLQAVGGRNAVNLTAGCALDDDEPAFSPDGRRIAYRSECGGGGVFVMGAMGESPRKVTDAGFNPDWSPDGAELALADEQLASPFGRTTLSRLWAVDVVSGERRLLSEHDAVDPAWSPDGRRVAFWGLEGDGSQRDLYTVAADGSQSAADAAVPVLLDPPVDWSPVWAPDSRSLLFASTRGGTTNLWRIALDPASGRAGGEPEPITAPSSWAGYLTSSRDGRRLAFVDRNTRDAVRVAPFDPVAGKLSGPARTVPLGTVEADDAISLPPASAGVLFASSGLPQHLFLAADGSDLRQLTDGPHRDRQGMFSRDGTWIVFQTDRWPSTLALIRPDGSGLRELRADGLSGAWYPRFSPDGRWLAAAANAGAFRVPMSGPDATGPVEWLPAPGEGLAFWPSSWSPDGRRLAGSLVPTSGVPAGAAVLDLAAGTYRQVADDATRPVSVRFLPDGRRLLLATIEGVRVLDLAGGAPTELVAPAAGAAVIWADLAADGRRLVWHEQSDESDIWLATFE